MMNSVPAVTSTSPMGAIEKMLSPGLPCCFKSPFAMRNAGAPMIAMVVPREAAKDIGISSLEAGIFLSLEIFNMIGTMMAVSVTWCVTAEGSATSGIMTAMMRSNLVLTSPWIHVPNLSESPPRRARRAQARLRLRLDERRRVRAERAVFPSREGGELHDRRLDRRSEGDPRPGDRVEHPRLPREPRDR